MVNIFEQMAQVRKHLPELAPQLFHIITKHHGIQPFKLTWLQTKFLTDPNVGGDIILKARQLGISTMTVIEFLAYFLFIDGFNGVIISKDVEHTKYLLKMARLALDMLPEKYQIPLKNDRENYLISDPPVYDKHGKRIGGGRGSSIYIGTAGQLTFGHGITMHAAHCSELSRWLATEKGDAATILKGLEQAVPDVPGAILRIESTANGRGDTFHQKYRQAARGEGRYRAHFFPWWFAIDDEYRITLDRAIEFTDEERELIERIWDTYEFRLSEEHINWRRRKQQSFDPIPGLEFFFEEYPEDAETCFVQTGNSVFKAQMALLNTVYKRLEHKEPYMSKDRYGLTIKIWKFPKSACQYAMAVDCAEAEKRKSNLHAAIIGEINGKGICEEAVTISGKCSSSQLADVIADFAQQYRALVAVERTSIGYSVLDKLSEAVNTGDYDFTLYSHLEFDQVAGEKVRILGFRPTRSAQDAAIGRWGEDFMNGEYIIHDSEVASQAMDYIHEPKTGKPSAPTGGYDDFLDCALILNYVKDEVSEEHGRFDVDDWE